MKTIEIKLYSFSELDKEAQEKALIAHANFLISTPVSVKNEDGELEDEYQDEYSREDVIESITVNDYLFYNDGEMASVTHYTGNHDRAGQTEFHFHGQNFLLHS